MPPFLHRIHAAPPSLGPLGSRLGRLASKNTNGTLRKIKSAREECFWPAQKKEDNANAKPHAALHNVPPKMYFKSQVRLG